LLQTYSYIMCNYHNSHLFTANNIEACTNQPLRRTTTENYTKNIFEINSVHRVTFLATFGVFTNLVNKSLRSVPQYSYNSNCTMISSTRCPTIHDHSISKKHLLKPCTVFSIHVQYESTSFYIHVHYRVISQ
jgi:hypothetical protein